MHGNAGRRGAPARAQAPRGKAVCGDGGQRRLGAGLGQASPADLALLAAPERPIVLLPASAAGPARSAARGRTGPAHVLGVMLPCTPIQYLLFHEAAGRPPAWLAADAAGCCW
jgi:hypothetical protein